MTMPGWVEYLPLAFCIVVTSAMFILFEDEMRR